MAGDVDPGTARGAELLGRLGDDALVVRGQRRLVPGEEHQILAGRFHERRVRTVGAHCAMAVGAISATMAALSSKLLITFTPIGVSEKSVEVGGILRLGHEFPKTPPER